MTDSTPEVWLSRDRRTLKVRHPAGQITTLESGQADGFTDAQVQRAAAFPPTTHLLGQKDVAWRRTVGTWSVLVEVNTGPPTWWVPRVSVKDGLMVGWIRGLIAISIKRTRTGQEQK